MKRVIAWSLILILCLGLFAGCKKNKETTPENNSGVNVVDTADLEAALEYVKTVYRKVSETTPQDFKRIGVVPVNGVDFEVVWTVNVDEDVVKVVKGDDGMVTIDVNEKIQQETPYVLTATISDGTKSVSHDWNHILPAAMSIEDMLEIVKAAYALENGQSMGYDVTLQGKITMINTPWSDDYQNITVTIVVEGAEDMPIQCYRLKGEGAKDLRIGDIITVTGELKNYNGTIEFDAGCTLDAVIKGEEIKAPEDPKQIVDEAYALGANESLPYEATLTGVITEVGTPYNAQYGNVTVTMVVEGRESKPIVCYRLKGSGADKIGVNDLITVKGYITNYVGSKGKSTIEFVAGCQLLAWEDRAAPTQPSDPCVVVDQAYALGANETLKYEATLTGKITKVNTAYDPAYGNVSVTMVVAGRETKPILCYRMKGTGVDKISIGDTITVKGYITNYVGDKGYSTIEYNYPTLVSYVKNTAVAPTDSLTIVKEAYALEPGTQLPYEATVTGKITKVNTPYDPGYKNVTVTIVVEGAENMPLKCYRLKGDGADKIGVGDIITVKGFIENYVHSSGDTEVEFTAGCILVSWENVGEDVPEKPATEISIADAIALGLAQGHNTYTLDKYKVTGVITEVYNTQYGNMKITDGNGNILTIYGTYDVNGNRYDAMTNKPVAGDTVTIEGLLGQYNDVAQIKNGVIVAHTPAGGTQPEQPDEPSDPATAPEMVTAPVVGTAYKMYMNKTSDGKYLYFNGQTESATVTYRLATTENAAEAVDVYLENANGGYNLYFMNGNVKTYIRIFERTPDEKKGSLELVTSAPAEVLTYNSDYNTLVHTATTGQSYYMGTYSTYTTFSVSNLSYMSADNLDVSQFPAHLGLVTATEDPTPDVPTPDDPTPDVPVEPDEPAGLTFVDVPEVGVAYKFGMQQNGLATPALLTFIGEMSGFYYGTSEDATQAVDVYLEEATGGYHLYFMDASGAKVYMDIVQRDGYEDKVNVVLNTTGEHTVYTLNTEFKYLQANVLGIDWYLGTYGTNKSISASKTTYIEDTSLIGVSQFCAWFLEGEATDEPTPDEPTPDVPVEPDEPAGLTFVDVPEVGVAYKFGMQQNGLATPALLTFIGEMSGFYYGTSEDATQAVDVYLEEATGGYHLYFMDASGAKVYMDIVQRDGYEDKVNVVLNTTGEHTVYTLNTEFKYLQANVLGIDWYLGTYGTNKSISASKTSYIADTSLIGVSQFCAWFLEGEATDEPTPDEPTPDAPTGTTAGLMTELPVADDVVIIYNSGMAMTATASSGKLAGETAAVTDGLLTVTDGMAQMTVVKEGDYFIFLCGGKYLTSAPTGNGLTFESELTDCGKWTITAVDGTNAWIITNVGANYNGNYNQAMETYNGNFTTYGAKETEIYQMQLFKVGGAAPEVTPPAGDDTTDPSEPENTEPEGTEPVTPPATTGSYTKIGTVADLTAGTYLVAAFAESYNDTDFSANPYHFWDGQITTGTNCDMVTNTYAFADGELTKYENSAVGAAKNGNAVEIELIAVDGKDNTYYIKYGDQYLTATYAKRKLALSSEPAEWIAENHKDGGVVLHHYVDSGFVTVGFAGAATNMIRSYKDSSGAMNTGIKGGLFFFKAN